VGELFEDEYRDHPEARRRVEVEVWHPRFWNERPNGILSCCAIFNGCHRGMDGGQCPTWIYSLRRSIITIIQNEDVRNYFYGNKSKVGCCVCNMIWSLVFSRVCF
jgi:hypothetical protein